MLASPSSWCRLENIVSRTLSLAGLSWVKEGWVADSHGAEAGLDFPLVALGCKGH